MDNTFDVETSLEGEALILRPIGDLNMVAKQAFLDAAIPAVVSGKTVVVDLAAVRYIDSSGLSALVTCHQAAQDAGGRFLIRNPADQVAYILKATGLADELFRTEM